MYTNPDAVYPPWYYRTAIAVARPLYRLFLATKRAKLPYYEREIAERFGTNYKRPQPTVGTKVIWCHAVSLGELNTAYPLLKSLLDEGYGLFVTSTTQTGFKRALYLFDHEIDTGQVVNGFVPIDDLAVVYRFLVQVSPTVAVFVETELWANTLYCLARYDVPSVLINARLVDKSLAGYQRFPKLAKSMMANLSLVIAQNESSLQNFIQLGLHPDKAVVADSLKWSQPSLITGVPSVEVDIAIPKDRPIWIAASTHDGEEQVCLALQKRFFDEHRALLILVPRHPERFGDVYQLCLSLNLKTARRSKDEPITADTQVYLADSMGELMYWYARSSVAFVGGSLVPIGGHNPAEPASLGVPVVMGKYTEACQLLLQELMEVGAAVQVGDKSDVTGLSHAIEAWLFDKALATKAGQAGKQLAKQKSQALNVQKDHLNRYLS